MNDAKMGSTKPISEYFTDIKYTDFAHMDGTNQTAKMADVARAGAFAGFNWACFHTIVFHPATPGQAALSFVNKTALFAIMGATFAGTTSILANVTGHDRKINYFMGGCVAGTLLGARSHSIAVGAQGCAFFGGLAALRKFYDENGWEFK